ncbi:hypothetical protein RMN57_04770 [Kitasatospora sp. CM 4170]|uniref:Uncharacterized protein n=1 Tax=Kitasatospora aburaviensis TaxID=67265 RepID=A0ABW1EVP1_9ACTN|nr:hypothetical protein [Kitasatospora sp. CM 4170]WNM50336.1 hypothetical protein RMN57_04770 [Kitasatospora sp. CM 4170]
MAHPRSSRRSNPQPGAALGVPAPVDGRTAGGPAGGAAVHGTTPA